MILLTVVVAAYAAFSVYNSIQNQKRIENVMKFVLETFSKTGQPEMMMSPTMAAQAAELELRTTLDQLTTEVLHTRAYAIPYGQARDIAIDLIVARDTFNSAPLPDQLQPLLMGVGTGNPQEPGVNPAQARPSQANETMH